MLLFWKSFVKHLPSWACLVIRAIDKEGKLLTAIKKAGPGTRWHRKYFIRRGAPKARVGGNSTPPARLGNGKRKQKCLELGLTWPESWGSALSLTRVSQPIAASHPTYPLSSFLRPLQPCALYTWPHWNFTLFPFISTENTHRSYFNTSKTTCFVFTLHVTKGYLGLVMILSYLRKIFLIRASGRDDGNATRCNMLK
jgi:hypothetical protein